MDRERASRWRDVITLDRQEEIDGGLLNEDGWEG